MEHMLGTTTCSPM